MIIVCSVIDILCLGWQICFNRLTGQGAFHVNYAGDTPTYAIVHPNTMGILTLGTKSMLKWLTWQGWHVLYTVNIIYFLKLYSVNIHTVWQSIQAQTYCSYTYHFFSTDLTPIHQQFCNLTPDISGVEWMECALRPSISVWRFHAGWPSCRMKPNKQILSDVVYCICFKCEMCILWPKPGKLVWKYSL
jgi:hypothetical protein